MSFPVQDYPYAACFARASLVLSPENYPQDNFLPPEGAGFLEHCAFTKNIVLTLRGAYRNLSLFTIHYSLSTAAKRLTIH